jgi:circadian clock protein KaiC
MTRNIRRTRSVAATRRSQKGVDADKRARPAAAAKDDPRVSTSVRNLDALLEGGLPRGSVTMVAGPPGSGKTILAQQIAFHNATRKTAPVLYFSTLSEPTAKTLRYLSRFSFFDPAALERSMRFIDLGVILRTDGLAKTFELIMQHVKKLKPSMVIIDSFKVFDDLAKSQEDLRKFGYELAVNLMAWEVTALLLGEYALSDVQTNPLFSITDGLIMMTQREHAGEQQRFIQVMKMRGTKHSRDEHTFQIHDGGVDVFAPRVTIRREPYADTQERCRTGIAKLDELLGEGIPRGSALLVSGVAGTGKTVLALELIYRGALAGEKGIVFSFEETSERLLASARGFGWDFEAQIDKGMIELVFIPQPDILVESHLLMMQERVEKMGAKRVALDSLSVFLHKVNDPQICREKTFQLASIVQNAGAVGFFTTDVPYGSDKISRFGVEETVVDGVIILSATEERFERHRYLEVYKLRNTAHLKGRHNMVIEHGGVSLYPRYLVAEPSVPGALTLDPARRLSTGVPGLDALMSGGVISGSVTLVSGSAGTGKTTMGMQFVVEGAHRGEKGAFVSLEEEPEHLIGSATTLGLELAELREKNIVTVDYLGSARLRANQLLSILAERVMATGAKRVVLDGADRLLTDAMRPEELRDVLFTLVSRLRGLGVTTWLSLEARSLFTGDDVTERSLSAIADNLILLRYRDVHDELSRTLTILKTRNSDHDLARHTFEIAHGGVRILHARSRRRTPARASLR